MTLLLLAHFVAAAVAPGLAKLLNRRSFLVLALVPAVTFAWLLAQTSRVTDGHAVVEQISWVPQLGMDFDLRLGTLQWLLGLLVSGVGALALVYCAWYFKPDDPSLWRFTGVFTAFAGAMLGLVLADNLMALYVFWELTTVFSYTLIGHNPVRSANRRSATQALLVTTFGGLAMLVGTVVLGETSSYTISEMLADPPPAGTLTNVAVLLVLVGALTKSAQVPFHFWLPGAMAAPTPVSAYLHAASMVKAGIYLILLLEPIFADVPGWRPVLLVLGLWTMILGGWRALRQDDIKLLLAYGTVSQLGFMTVLAGIGSKSAGLAALALVFSHALFKSVLFFAVGIIDKGTGTRDLTQLHGVARSAPLLAVAATLSAASMAGLPPLVGFVAKESALTAAIESAHGPLTTTTGWLTVAGLVVGSVLTVAYSARFVWGAFMTKGAAGTSPAPTPFHAPKALLVAPVLLSLTTLASGFFGDPLTELFHPYAVTLPGAEPEHLALWHGLTPALGLTVLAIAAGLALFALRGPFAALQERLPAVVDAERVYQRFMHSLDRFAVETTALSQGGSLPTYLSTIFIVVLVLPGAVAATALPGSQVRLWDSLAQAVVAAFVICGAVLAVRSRNRLQSVMFVGTTGYGLALLFLLHGAPDLALTQVLVETFSLVLFVLVLRKLPERFRRRPRAERRSWRRSWRLVLAGSMGLAVSAITVVAANARVHEPISRAFPKEAYAFGHGKNIVNVTLVDIRAWDTLGEISVLVAAATGIASLVFVRTQDVERSWTRRHNQGEAITSVAPERRSVILETATRLVFHVMILLSLYLLLAGHNQVGGGFAGGLVLGLALLVRYLAGGRAELDHAAPVSAGFVLGAGLAVSAIAALAPLAFGGTVLQSAVVDLDLPIWGEVKLVTALFFDIGVYLIVIGLALDVVRSLGSGIDKQAEEDEVTA
ncbi:Na+/H+ antiporter subunit A [Janibacter limosus]|uniref:Na+/H+ antiporter subunit A n=1 Tax=Janibacter limosus TaxID=53458 RepID=UPI000830B6B4|nr:Na+/H+ antiporter subunit A [Janibacter limosus]